ncbi:MAG: thioredoxin family protein [Thiobacillus sp.]|nr:thioredoxin family protein [Thiobacillus sp.]
MNDSAIRLTLVGTGESAIRLRKRLGCAARELGLRLDIVEAKQPEACGLDFAQTPAVMAGNALLFSGLMRTEEIVPLLRARFGTGKARDGEAACAA